ncbi:hypothetical protein QQP08_006709 [Theobroma cacao]|nr:hypothetical protein QQP08_006709 [Theobroma cacao]
MLASTGLTFWAQTLASLFRKGKMAGPCTIKVLDHSNASPPPGSVPDTSLPLTFFDVPWLVCRPMQRLFFYEFPYSTLHFTQTILPSLRTSLSHALQTFYPFAAKLICPPSPHKPHILYTDGDCVSFTVAESSADFDRTVAYLARDVKELHPFVPQLQPSRVLNNTRVLPLLALQVTVFPNSGICIGATFCHVAADGRSFNHFMKAWASILRSGGNSAACLEKSVPFLERNVIREKDSRGLESILMTEWWSWASDWEEDKEISETGHLVTISGSPKLRAYETDFGWGKPKKTEVVQIDVSGAIYLGDSRDEEGGIEIGLALNKDEMEAFHGFFEQGLKTT